MEALAVKGLLGGAHSRLSSGSGQSCSSLGAPLSHTCHPLFPALQTYVDPDEIFQQHQKTCSLDEVFANGEGEGGGVAGLIAEAAQLDELRPLSVCEC